MKFIASAIIFTQVQNYKPSNYTGVNYHPSKYALYNIEYII